MCAIIAAVLLFLGGLFGVSLVSSSASLPNEPLVVEATAEAVMPTQMFACASPSQAQDAADMLALVGKTFTPDFWNQTVSSTSTKNTATWTSTIYGALAYLEYLHYDCGVSQAQIDQYFSVKSFQSILSNYDSYELADQCKQGSDLTLYEFSVVSHGANYDMRYWVKEVSPTRVADLMLVFPEAQRSREAEYAGQLFPDLPTCQKAAG